MLPDFIPHFSVGPLIGFVSNGIIFILCLFTFILYRHYRPLKSLLLFYLFLTLSFMGWMIYGLQKSPESILLWNRIQYAGFALLPGIWIWFYLAFFNEKPGLITWVISAISLILVALVLFGTGPWFFGFPLIPDSVGSDVLRPESRFLKPLVLSFCLGACLFYLILIIIKLFRGRDRPLYTIPLLIGLLAWLLGGTLDALRVVGIVVIGKSYFLWFTSLWLSLSLIIATMLHFRNLGREVRDELRQLNQAKSRVLDHLSHELITPISLIQGSTRVLKGKLHLQGGTLFEIIEAQLDRLKNIQHEATVMIRSHQEGGGVSSFEPILLLPFTERVMEEVKGYTTHRNIRFHLDDTSKDLCLLMVPRILEDILEGLLKNAVENTPDQGMIRISWEQKGEWILLKVQDFGTGITEENQRHIFEGFFHTRDSALYTTRKPYDFNAGGKGLDLLRMKIYGERFGFNLSVESRRCIYIPTDRDLCPGKISACPHCRGPEECQSSGSTFFISFPSTMNSFRFSPSSN